MSCAEYKIILGNRTANDEELDAVSDITVEQIVGMIWEATINLSINMDEKGIWNIKDKDFTNPQFRARIEVKTKNSFFIPLIDGPIIQNYTDLRSEPGLSSMKLVINDDSILLNKDEEILQFRDKKDSDIASEIYQNAFGNFIRHQVEQTTALPDTINFRGTSMQLLHKLAARNEMYAYVLPGDEPGMSKGCFNSHQTSAYADLILLSENRNIESLKINVNLLKPSIVKNSNINPKKSDVESQIHPPDYSTSELLGDNPIIRNDGQVASNVIRLSKRLFHPTSGFSLNTEQLARAQAKKSGFLVEATGELFEGAEYPNILMPYHYITVKAGNSPHSGKYFITKVTHKITPSNYTQSFTLVRNAHSDISKTVETEIIS
jgi:hypothetical protein